MHCWLLPNLILNYKLPYEALRGKKKKKESFYYQLYEGLGPILTTQYIDKTQERAKYDIFY